jgi:hypothetical protein
MKFQFNKETIDCKWLGSRLAINITFTISRPEKKKKTKHATHRDNYNLKTKPIQF